MWHPRVSSRESCARVSKVSGKPTILCVEDDPALLRMLERVLSQYATVSTAKNGEEAITLIRETELRPDLVVTDVMMPKVDGLELAKLLKAEAKTANVPVIMLTAKSGPGDVIKGINAGARNYLTKPFKQQELIDKVKKILRV